MSDRPLVVTVKDGILTISIGVATLAWAAEHMDAANPHNDDTGEFEQKLKVLDAESFARDVVLALEDEAEDGTTAVHLLLDAACLKAWEEGSLYCAEEP